MYIFCHIVYQVHYTCIIDKQYQYRFKLQVLYANDEFYVPKTLLM